MQDPIAYQQSIDVLHKASTPSGFVAALQEQDNYKRVWTRDGTICSLAALLSGDEKLIATAKATIHTIFTHQHSIGYMPSNVTPTTNAASYGGIVGRADNPSWAVIGLCQYALMTKDVELANTYYPQVEKCFWILEAWEYNGKNLVYVPQSGDWADEYIQHGYVLFAQLLRVWALRLAAQTYQRPDWAAKACAITTTIQNNFWQQENASKLYHPHWQQKIADAFQGYWLMGINPSRVYPYFDLQANAFSLLLNIGTAEQTASVVKFSQQLFKDGWNNLLPSFYPTIYDADADMQELKGNYAYTFRNKPHQFHNGGLWAVWNGWMAMAISSTGHQDFAKAITRSVHKANLSVNNQFNECLHGKTQAPCGVPYCTWSAAGAVIAEQALQGNFLITHIDL